MNGIRIPEHYTLVQEVVRACMHHESFPEHLGLGNIWRHVDITPVRSCLGMYAVRVTIRNSLHWVNAMCKIERKDNDWALASCTVEVLKEDRQKIMSRDFHCSIEDGTVHTILC